MLVIWWFGSRAQLQIFQLITEHSLIMSRGRPLFDLCYKTMPPPPDWRAVIEFLLQLRALWTLKPSFILSVTLIFFNFRPTVNAACKQSNHSSRSYCCKISLNECGSSLWLMGALPPSHPPPHTLSKLSSPINKRRDVICNLTLPREFNAIKLYFNQPHVLENFSTSYQLCRQAFVFPC